MDQISESLTAIGIDVGGTELKAVLGNGVGIIGEPLRMRSEGARRPEQLVWEIREVAETLISRASDVGVEICGIGLAIPGRVDASTGRGEFSANLGWSSVSIGPELEALLDLTVHVEHDVYAGALAEFTIGAGQGVDRGAFVAVGTGLAAALLFGGRIWRGASRFAGEVGHISVDGDETLCGCGRRGCAELFASASGLVRAYSRFSGQNGVEAKVIAARAVNGDHAAVKAWEVCVHNVARVLAALTLTVDVETVVVGGGISESGSQLLDPLVLAVAEKLAPLRAAPEIRLAALGQMAGARGASLHALTKSAAAGSPKVVTGAITGSESPAPPIFMLAFDHRASTAAELFNCETVSPQQWEMFADMKTVIAAAAGSVRSRVGGIGEVAVLVDPECGQDAAQVAQSEGIPTALALEVSGHRHLQLLDQKTLESAIDSIKSPRWGKVLLRWNPRDHEETKAANLATLEQARRFCDSVGIDLLLEVIVPSTASDLDIVDGSSQRYRSEVLPLLLPVAVGEITQRFGPPDLWKLEGVASPVSAAAVSEAACCDGNVPPIVVLGAGAAPDEIATWFNAGAGVRGYAGFAIGRSIWKAPIAGLLNGRLDRNTARDMIAAGFNRFVENYMSATRFAMVSGRR